MKNGLYKLMIICLSILVVSCEEVENFSDFETPRYSGDFAPSLSTAPEEINVVTFNIEFAEKIEEAIEELGSSENLMSADVILLQEMDETGTEAIAKALEYNYVYYPSNRNFDGKLFGLAILSKWPIVEDEKIILPHKPNNERQRIAISANVMTGSQSIRIYNIHTATFTLSRSKRREQFRTVITHLEELEAIQRVDHVLIAGDFNTNDSNDIDYLVEFYGAEGFLWASEEVGATYQIIGGLAKYSLDHAFIRGFDFVDAGKNTETLSSDHLPIWMKLRF